MIVLIISTDDCQALIDALLGAGFEVIVETSSVNAIRRLMEEDPVVIIVSEDMPSTIEGLDLLPVLSRFSNAPVVIIGSGGNENGAMVEALLGGADEYYSRPVNLEVLLARIRAMLRRYTEGGQPPPNRPPNY